MRMRRSILAHILYLQGHLSSLFARHKLDHFAPEETADLIDKYSELCVNDTKSGDHGIFSRLTGVLKKITSQNNFKFLSICSRKWLD